MIDRDELYRVIMETILSELEMHRPKDRLDRLEVTEQINDVLIECLSTINHSGLAVEDAVREVAELRFSDLSDPRPSQATTYERSSRG
jgi:hypothetical protein